MSVNKIIEDALNEIVQEIWPMVCPRDKPPREYIVYNPEIDVPDDFGDNEPQSWVQHMQIHYFIAENGDYTLRRKEIRKSLQKAGFTISEITTLHEKESGYNHVCVSCSIEEREE